MSNFDAQLFEHLRVRLTQEEVVQRAEELARHMAETLHLREARAEMAKAAAEQIKRREAEEQRRAQDIALGSEVREVGCFEVPRFADLLVDIVRVDTREVVRTRAMQPDERQTDLWGEPAPTAPEAAQKNTKH